LFLKQKKFNFYLFLDKIGDASYLKKAYLYKKIMSRYTGPRLRIIRRLGKLPGLTTKSTNRNSLPGQHAILQKQKKYSQYAIRLQEKQKLRYNYGINEKQLIKYVRVAKKLKGSTGEILLQLLEMRLDNIIFRLGLAPTIVAARQYISHGHFLVNNKKINIPSYQCKINDIISISIKKKSKNLIQNNLNVQNSVVLPSHLNFDKDNFSAKVLGLSNRQSINLDLNELLIIEYYSRKV
jgi:small subunit ribosomal protein S4